MSVRPITLKLVGTNGSDTDAAGLRLMAMVASKAWGWSGPPHPDAAGSVCTVVDDEEFASVYRRTIRVLNETRPDWPSWVELAPL